MSNTLPQTSYDAHKSMTDDIIENHHKKIIEALLFLKKATYEEIATYLNWDDKNRVSRRLIELERDQVVYKPGEKRPTKSKRQAFVYSLYADDKYTQGSFFD